MPYEYNENLTDNAKELRKNMTPEEKHLWYDFLKLLPVTVNRQKTVGSYIVDFYIHFAKLVIEIDGMQHGTPEHEKADERRDRTLEVQGITVLRYTNRDINQRFDEVCQDIMRHLGIYESE